ncbi:thiol:disulfide interchange protein DsbG [soil metagenome]
MTFKHLRALFLAPLFAAAALAANAEALPPALQALQKQGVTIVGPFESRTGLKAYAATVSGRPAALYITPSGAIIAGTALDNDGQALDGGALEAAARKPLGEGAWNQLAASRWIADGRPNAPRTVYIFTDPNCPYCAKLWLDARPWVDSGKVQIRHVLVGILTPTSTAKAAALLTAKDPGAALADYERVQAPAISKALAGGGRPHPLSDNGLKPLAKVPADVAAQLEANARLMQDFGMQATPGVVWRDAQGAVQKRTGIPDTALIEIFGSK